GVVGLDVDVEVHVGQFLEYVLEARDRRTPADLRAPDDVPRLFGDRPGAVGRAVQQRVVVDDDDAVGGRVDVRLDVAVPLLGGAAERGQRVLQSFEIAQVPSAMREGTGDRGVEVRMD